MASQTNGPPQICCKIGMCPPQWPACPPMLPFARPIPVSSNSTDPNFSILVIAILGILATTFLLVSYYAVVTKCCIRWNALGHHGHHRFSYTQNTDTEPWIPNSNGLEDSVIHSIPIVHYKDQDGFLDCAVCLNEFQDGESLRLLPKCSHTFHLHCIDVWLQSNSNCPLCRANIVSPELDNAQEFNNEISATHDVQRGSHSEVPVQPSLENAGSSKDGVSTSTIIDINEQKGFDLGKNVRSKNPTSKLPHVSSLKHIRTDMDCYWEDNILKPDNTSTRGKRNQSDSVHPMRRSFSMDSSLQRLWIDLNTSDGPSSIKKSSLFSENGRGGIAILPV